ncbi:threonine synthase [Pandoraea pulmonicola]|uniref:Threonine synthase n=1 Tax=Pandoraea pulmonicola TaxID=93221 RepID=A0AAJ4ZC77_PANPU|nr:pyridoxal-phosphate dependent enzyme [Pandoraea pulmonicola]SUA90571.1 Threonine synthase [Pandoraea pulmonicola]
MSPAFSHRYSCVCCAAPQPWGGIRYRCNICGQNLRIERLLDAQSPRGEDIVRTFHGRGMWRYASLLPVEPSWGSRLAVGDTPLIDCGDDEGVHLQVKDEARNPSGSLKDRATEMVLAAARFAGCTQTIAASTGNAGASLACIAASQRMPATVIVPAGTPPAKLAQIHAYGAKVVEIDGSYDDAFEIAERISADVDVCCRNTGINPFTREGKKTCAFEIAEAFEWCVPDWVVVPTGDGNILSGIAAGFFDLFSLGITCAMPRLLAAQAVTSDSITRDWESGADRTGTLAFPASPAVVRPETVADSLSVSRPRDHLAALQALRATQGACVAVDDGAIMEASCVLARRFGLWFEPSTATGYAALRESLVSGRIRAGETVVLLGTGSGLKSPNAFDGAMSCAPQRFTERSPQPAPGVYHQGLEERRR